MKNYFNFQLTGKKFFPLWIAFYVLILVPYIFILIKLQEVINNKGLILQQTKLLFVMFLIIVLTLLFLFFVVKIILKNISFNETPFLNEYKFPRYLWIVLSGIFLSIVTLGIYIPWFIKNVFSYFTNNMSFKGYNPRFRGKGGDLFLIIILTVVIPLVWFFVLTIQIFGMNSVSLITQPLWKRALIQMGSYFLLIPYFYYSYKWYFNIRYKDFIIKWRTKLLPSMGKIAVQMFFSFISLGIYAPLAFLSLYKYFAENTESNIIDGKMLKFGYDIEPKKDFLLIWGQILLSVITLGIYYPWAFCKICSRIMAKTYIDVKSL